uniref:Ion_trans domain-containing protein n=1 Tax=Haemonchus placei TaxID=6290 RepID=A0A0N4WHK7_HAEPC
LVTDMCERRAVRPLSSSVETFWDVVAIVVHVVNNWLLILIEELQIHQFMFYIEAVWCYFGLEEILVLFQVLDQFLTTKHLRFQGNTIILQRSEKIRVDREGYLG